MPLKMGWQEALVVGRTQPRARLLNAVPNLFETRAHLAWLQITTTDWKSEMHCLKMLTFQDFQDEHISCALQLEKSRHNRNEYCQSPFEDESHKAPKVTPHWHFQDLPPFC